MIENLKQYRMNRGYSHQGMANKLRISKSYYWQIENDLRRLSYDMAVKIADIFNTMPDNIFYEHFKNKIKGETKNTYLSSNKK